MICKKCDLEKQSQYCSNCRIKTPTLFTKTFSETITITDWLRNLFKSREKINNKPIKEIEQYVGNKDKDVISEFKRIRSKGTPTIVIHRLWRQFHGVFRKVHEHTK